MVTVCIAGRVRHGGDSVADPAGRKRIQIEANCGVFPGLQKGGMASLENCATLLPSCLPTHAFRTSVLSIFQVPSLEFWRSLLQP